MKNRHKILADWMARSRQDEMLFDAMEAELWERRCMEQEKRAIEDFEKMVYEIYCREDNERDKSDGSQDAEDADEESDPG